VSRRLRQFGSGDLASLFTGIGPHRELIGQPAPAVGRASVRASVTQAGLFADVHRSSGVVPTQIAGDLRGGAGGATRDLAIAVNGRIEAVGRSFYLDGDSTEHFAFMVPESSLHEGRNSLQLYEVVAGKLRRL
jgi:hypothetical protein